MAVPSLITDPRPGPGKDLWQVSEERFNRLYERNARDLLGYLIRRTDGHENAADCLAETFLVAWRKRDEIPSDEAAARPWLFGIARNVARRERELGNKQSGRSRRSPPNCATRAR